jgi:hypothetical protein
VAQVGRRVVVPEGLLADVARTPHGDRLDACTRPDMGSRERESSSAVFFRR